MADQDDDYPGDICGCTMWWVVDEVRRAVEELKIFLYENSENLMFVYSGSY